MAIKFDDLEPGYYWMRQRSYIVFSDSPAYYVNEDTNSIYSIIKVSGTYPFYKMHYFGGREVDFYNDIAGLEIFERMEEPSDTKQ